MEGCFPGGYRRVRLLGRGASGEVWEVRNPQSNEVLALKEVDISLLSAKQRDLALQEVRLLSQVAHPHIVRFVNFVVVGLKLCLIMSYMAGGDLRSLIVATREAVQRLPEIDIWRWLLQVARALQYLHAERVLHRDVKPANIFLSTERHSVVLGDLGVARVLDNSFGAAALTQVGTPSYLAPEVWLGRPYGRPADLYSMGCTAFELAELRMPFVAENRAILSAQVIKGPPPFLSDAASVLYSQSLHVALRLLLDTTPGLRPSAAQFLATFRSKDRPSLLTRTKSSRHGAGAISPRDQMPPKSCSPCGTPRRRVPSPADVLRVSTFKVGRPSSPDCGPRQSSPPPQAVRKPLRPAPAQPPDVPLLSRPGMCPASASPRDDAGLGAHAGAKVPGHGQDKGLLGWGAIVPWQDRVRVSELRGRNSSFGAEEATEQGAEASSRGNSFESTNALLLEVMGNMQNRKKPLAVRA